MDFMKITAKINSLQNQWVTRTPDSWVRNVKARKNEIVDTILQAIKNETVKIYEEKRNLYEEALNNKTSNKDDEVVRSMEQKIENLKEL